MPVGRRCQRQSAFCVASEHWRQKVVLPKQMFVAGFYKFDVRRWTLCKCPWLTDVLSSCSMAGVKTLPLMGALKQPDCAAPLCSRFESCVHVTILQLAGFKAKFFRLLETALMFHKVCTICDWEKTFTQGQVFSSIESEATDTFTDTLRPADPSAEENKLETPQAVREQEKGTNVNNMNAVSQWVRHVSLFHCNVFVGLNRNVRRYTSSVNSKRPEQQISNKHENVKVNVSSLTQPRRDAAS